MGREMSNAPASQKQPSSVVYTVEQLVAVNPYNPDILPDLENYVNEQVSSQTYNLNANLCLLRLYQFEPARMSTQIVARILIKALMAMPAPDFSLCLFLIPERVPLCAFIAQGLGLSPIHLFQWYSGSSHFVHLLPKVSWLSHMYMGNYQQMEEQFKTLIVFSHYLETARFRQFWDEVAKSRHILEVVPGFEQAIQAYAIHVLSLTYQKVPRSVLAEAINIEGPSVDKLLDHHVANSGWEIEKTRSRGQLLIILPRNEFNHPELKKSSADGVPLEKIARIIPILG